MRVLCIMFLVIAAAIPSLAAASTTQGTVNANSYAWGENFGWINFAPTDANGSYEGLVITDATITGYAWSQEFGWINFAPTNGGVTNDSEGHLGGYAWSTSFGWINMNGATIDTNGIFSGVAGDASSTAGRINFSCSHCAVATDWRPLSVRMTPLSGGGVITSGGGAGSTISPPAGATTTTIVPSSTLPIGQPAIYQSWFQNVVHRSDVVRDGVIDIKDFNAMMINWGSTTAHNPADITGDGKVDILDFNQLMVYWGDTEF